jgi:hypothetical protein
MKKQILISLVLLGSVLTMNAQIYGTVAGSSGTNKVGIGTNQPSSALDVNGSISVSQQGTGTTLNPYETVALKSNVGDVNAYPSINFVNDWQSTHRSWMNFNIRDGNHNKITALTINGDGNVGIGTTAPSLKMVVAQDITNNGNVDAAQFGIMGSTDNRKRLVMGYDTNGDGFGFIKSGFYGVKWTNLVLQPQSNGGNVGIGTTSPSLKMVVAQDITNNEDVDVAQFGIMGSTDNRKRLVMGYDTNGDGFGFIKSGFYGVKWTNLVLQPQSNGGNVGIGTTSPTYKLDVCGTIRAKEIKVDLLGGCDFVFKKDYKLMSLNDLEKFVTTKQHLPEIASEKEMIENGLNMKEFQMKLLQKMEEMTLYIIEQNKELKVLKKKIVKLESASKGR